MGRKDTLCKTGNVLNLLRWKKLTTSLASVQEGFLVRRGAEIEGHKRKNTGWNSDLFSFLRIKHPNLPCGGCSQNKCQKKIFFNGLSNCRYQIGNQNIAGDSETWTCPIHHISHCQLHEQFYQHSLECQSQKKL